MKSGKWAFRIKNGQYTTTMAIATGPLKIHYTLSYGQSHADPTAYIKATYIIQSTKDQ